MTYTNAETYGKLKVYKTGEMLTGFADGKFVYENRFLKGAEFEITAAEDIVTQDNQGINWYDKGEVVDILDNSEITPEERARLLMEYDGHEWKYGRKEKQTVNRKQ